MERIHLADNELSGIPGTYMVMGPDDLVEQAEKLLAMHAGPARRPRRAVTAEVAR